jgi:hypothetical protein
VKISPGWRTVTFGTVSLAFLTVGLGLCLGFPAPGKEIFGAFSLAVAGITATIAAKHGVESLAEGGGTGGVWKVLTTDAKPGAPPPAPPGGAS